MNEQLEAIFIDAAECGIATSRLQADGNPGGGGTAAVQSYSVKMPWGWKMGHLVEPGRLLADMEWMGVDLIVSI